VVFATEAPATRLLLNFLNPNSITKKTLLLSPKF
jgi:hypothetical protein